MQCLYCKKKLGLFASKKRQFCSEDHEAAYNEEQASIALQRVLDPMFTGRLQKQPLQPAPPRIAPGSGRKAPAPGSEFNAPSYLQPASPAFAAGPDRETTLPASSPVAPAKPPALTRLDPPAPPQPEMATFHPVVAPPPLVSFYRQSRPIPHPSTQSTALAPYGTEPLGGDVVLPQRWGELIADEFTEDELIEDQFETAAPVPVEEPLAAQEPLAAEDTQPEAVEAKTIESHRLHPAITQEKPACADMDLRSGAGSLRFLNFRTPMLKHVPVAWEVLAEEPPAAAAAPQLEEAAPQLDEAEPAAGEADVAQTSVPDTAAVSQPVYAGLLRVEALRPRAVEQVRQAGAETHGAIEARLTLRYPSARIPIGRRMLGRAGLGHPELAQAGFSQAGSSQEALPDAARQGMELRDLTVTGARLPELTLQAVSRSAALGERAHTLLELPRRAQNAGLREVRWKVFTALREAPAKLAMPQAGSGRHVARALAHPAGMAGCGSLERRAIQPGGEANLISREAARDLATVALPEAPAEVLEGKIAVKVGKAEWFKLEPQAHADRRQSHRPSSLVAGLSGFQKVRAASYIQIREPELRQAIPGGLPRGTVGTAWLGMSLGGEEWPLRAAVPLRPAVRPPHWN